MKTSTGFGTGGATADDVRLMRKTVDDRLKVKASGGIRSYHDAILLLDAGADRIGAQLERRHRQRVARISLILREAVNRFMI